MRRELQQYLPFTVLKLDKRIHKGLCRNSELQQYLPFTVLKLVPANTEEIIMLALQQYLPFTVLKLQAFV